MEFDANGSRIRRKKQSPPKVPRARPDSNRGVIHKLESIHQGISDSAIRTAQNMIDSSKHKEFHTLLKALESEMKA